MRRTVSCSLLLVVCVIAARCAGRPAEPVAARAGVAACAAPPPRSNMAADTPRIIGAPDKPRARCCGPRNLLVVSAAPARACKAVFCQTREPVGCPANRPWRGARTLGLGSTRCRRTIRRRLPRSKITEKSDAVPGAVHRAGRASRVTNATCRRAMANFAGKSPSSGAGRGGPWRLCRRKIGQGVTAGARFAILSRHRVGRGISSQRKWC